MFERFAERQIREALSDTPVVLVTGPRRVGKTTLVHKFENPKRTYISLDNSITLDSARYDPVGVIRSLNVATIDEIQRVPELILAIKQSVDEDYRPGRFLLTGSADVMNLPAIPDSLAGRIEIIRMLPLSRAETFGVAPTFLDRLFDRNPRFNGKEVVGSDLIELVLRGGFPEALERPTEHKRQAWARSYLSSILSGDLREIARVEKLTELPQFVRMLAQHSGKLLNYSALGSGFGVSYKTAQRYTALLEQVFLVSVLRPWYTNALKRIVKTPKLHFLDPCLLATLRGLKFDRIRTNRNEFDPILESFVYSEVLKLISETELELSPYHFRDQGMHKVDIVLERDDRMIAGIEVKASATVRWRDFAGLRTLATACKERFAYGIVLYDGNHTVPFGENMAAVPISALWA